MMAEAEPAAATPTEEAESKEATAAGGETETTAKKTSSPPSPSGAPLSTSAPVERSVPAEIQTTAPVAEGTTQVTPGGAVPPTPSTPLTGIMQFASLYIGDLHPDVGEAILYEAFESAGRVASCRVCRDAVSRKSLGYGYVNYFSVADAERALDTLNYMRIKGKPCRVMWSQRDSKARKNVDSNIYVKNLEPTIDNKALHDAFKTFGTILTCKVASDVNGKSRGYGFVLFEAEDAAKQAIEKGNGMKLGESNIYVGPFLKKEEMEEKAADQYTNLYVKHIPPAWDEDKLSSVLGEHGEVSSVWLSSTEDGKRFALVNFKKPESAKAAVEALHTKDMTPEGLSPEAEEAKEAKKDKDKDTEKEKGEGEGEAAEAPVEKKASMLAEEEIPLHQLYVQRAQTRAERKAALEAERKRKKGAGKGAGGGATAGGGKAGGKGEAKPGVRLCVRNLDESTTEESLKELFSPHGQVLSAQVKLNEDGKCKGLAFVVVNTAEEAATCIKELHQKEVAEKAISVALVEKRPPKGDGADAGAGDGKGGGKKGAGKGKDKDGGKASGKGGKDSGKGGKSAGKGKGGAVLPSSVPPLPFGGAPPVPPNMPPGHTGPAGAFPGGRPPAHYVNSYPAPSPAAVYPPRPPFPGYMHPGMHPMYGRMPGMPGMPGMPTMPTMPTMPGGFPQAGMPSFPARPVAPPNQQQPLTREALARLPPQVQKQTLGERLHSLISRQKPQLAGKLTGMMLELDNNEIIGLIESDAKLQQRIKEASKVLNKK